MSKAIRNQLGAIERAIGLAPGGHADRVWVTPEEALAVRARMFALVGGLFPGMPWKLAAVCGRIELDFPSTGYWAKAASLEDERVLRAHITQLRATDGICPWRADPPLLEFGPADYGIVSPPRAG